MLLRFFRTNGAQIIVIIPIIGMILWLGPLLNTSKIPLLSDQIRLPLYDTLFGYLQSVEFIGKIVSFVLILAIAFLCAMIQVFQPLIFPVFTVEEVTATFYRSNHQRLNPPIFRSS